MTAVTMIEAPRGGYVLIHVPGDWGRGVRLYVGRFPVTNEEYLRYVEAEHVKPPRYWQIPGFDDPRQPVVGVTQSAALGYCQWAGLTLPTEAQWEHACGMQPPSELDMMAWHAGNSEERLRPVGGKAPNSFGLHDMLGNVWEWCLDDLTENTSDFSLVIDVGRRDGGRATPVHKAAGTDARVGAIRGGSWRSAANRTSRRSRVSQDARMTADDVGFRPALVLE